MNVYFSHVKTEKYNYSEHLLTILRNCSLLNIIDCEAS